MSFRGVGVILLIIGAILLALFDTPLIIALAGAAVILGFLVVTLDMMRRGIEKTD
jgi:hypothetical protein